MKYQPRKVFILENDSYQEITYQKYCQNQQSDESYGNRFFIPLQGMLLEVSREVYADFYREKERNRYLRKLDMENGLLSSEEQKLIHQHYYDEISEVELGREYGISQQAVSKRLKKVRERLKNLMEQ